MEWRHKKAKLENLDIIVLAAVDLDSANSNRWPYITLNYCVNFLQTETNSSHSDCSRKHGTVEPH